MYIYIYIYIYICVYIYICDNAAAPAAHAAAVPGAVEQPADCPPLRILYGEVFKWNPSGNEVYYIACSCPVILMNSCSKVHCQKDSDLNPFSCKVSCPFEFRGDDMRGWVTAAGCRRGVSERYRERSRKGEREREKGEREEGWRCLVSSDVLFDLNGRFGLESFSRFDRRYCSEALHDVNRRSC